MSKAPLLSERNAANFPSGEIAELLLAPSKLVSRVNCAPESGLRSVARGAIGDDPRTQSRHSQRHKSPWQPRVTLRDDHRGSRHSRGARIRAASDALAVGAHSRSVLTR